MSALLPSSCTVKRMVLLAVALSATSCGDDTSEAIDPTDTADAGKGGGLLDGGNGTIVDETDCIAAQRGAIRRGVVPNADLSTLIDALVEKLERAETIPYCSTP